MVHISELTTELKGSYAYNRRVSLATKQEESELLILLSAFLVLLLLQFRNQY
jgi:hypothetical protein